MEVIYASPRPRAPSFRILRELSNGRRVDIPVPALCSDTLILHAADSDAAIARARELGVSGRLIAISEAS
jgi:hypothetical protein